MSLQPQTINYIVTKAVFRATRPPAKERIGQAFMNVLHDVSPECYQKLVEHGVDPFHNDSLIEDACKLLAADIK